MPDIFRRICKWNGREMFCVMLAHGGIGLDFHTGEPEAAHNIVFGGYDFVVLQHRADPFCKETLFSAGDELARLVNKSGAAGIAYMPWPTRPNREKQKEATEAYTEFARKNGFEFAPAGEAWWEFADENPDVELFRNDDRHATKKGSYLAACCIYCAAFGERPKTDNERIHELMAEKAYKKYLEYKVK